MRNFSRIVARYSADRIGGMLAWSSNISIIFIVNSKIALVFKNELPVSYTHLTLPTKRIV